MNICSNYDLYLHIGILLLTATMLLHQIDFTQLQTAIHAVSLTRLLQDIWKA